MRTRRTALVVLLCAVIVALMLPQPSLAGASILKMEEGRSFVYTYARISTGSQGQESGEAVYKIISFNDTTLVVEASGVNTTTYRIDYEGGIPTYSQYLEGLVYLPPPCLEQSIKGDLNWTMQVKTGTLGRVANATARVQNLTAAFDFKVLNLTLELVGWNYGNLSMLYDLESGVLVREIWVPDYGDIIALELKFQPPASQPAVDPLTLIPSVATLVAPALIAFSWAAKRRKPEKRGGYGAGVEELEDPPVVTAAAPSRAAVMINLLNAAVLSVSTFLPWVLVAGNGVFLPNSLSSYFYPNQMTMSLSILSVASLAAHAASIAIWAGVAVRLLSGHVLFAKLVIAFSGILAFYSVWLLLAGGLNPFWGVPVASLGGVMAIAGPLVKESTRGASSKPPNQSSV